MLNLPELPKGYVLEGIREEDYDHNALELLSELTTVGYVSRENFNAFVKLQQTDMYNTIVIRNPQGKVVGISTLLIETKLIHGFSKVGHIEDVAVDSGERGNNIGLYMIRYLCNKGLSLGCYKVILDCDEKNALFYEKCGLRRVGIEMDYRG